LIRGTRDVADLESGASPRAGAMLAGAARARAAMEGRDFVIPDDVKALAPAPDPFARGRDRRAPGRGRGAHDHRDDRGAALIYPTRAAVLATAAGAPA